MQKGESWLYHAKRLEEFLAGKEYILGDKVSWADFLLFEIMEFQRVFVPGSLDAFPNLKAFSARVAAFPQVMTSSLYVAMSTVFLYEYIFELLMISVMLHHAVQTRLMIF